MRNLRNLLTTPASAPMCIFMGITMIAFGLPLLYPWPHVFSHYQTFAVVQRFGDERVLGLLFIGAGVWRIIAVLLGSYRQRTLAISAAIGVWCFLFLNFLMVDPSSPGATVFGAWMILDTWTLFRIRRIRNELA